MGWLITLAILLLIAITPVGVKLRYNSEGVLLAVILGPFRIGILPAKKKEKKPKKEKKKAKAKEQTGKKQEEPKPAYQTDPGPKPDAPKEKVKKKESGGSLLDFLPLVKVLLDFLADFGRGLRFDHVELKLILAGGDPCDLATNYGRAWAALGNLLPRLERIMVIRKRDIEVECDFVAAETTVIAGLDLTITIGRIFLLIFVLIFRAVKEFIKILIKRKKRKGGAAK